MSLLAVPDLLTDFAHGNGQLAVREGDHYTNMVFRKIVRERKRETDAAQSAASVSLFLSRTIFLKIPFVIP